jgi:hypothetical protein
MPIIASTNSTTRELIPAGNYVARCYQMIQIGTVNEIINGENKLLEKVRIGWEFPLELKTFNEEKGPQPIVVNEEYTLSMGEKANLRKMLASWRGKDFTPEEAKSFDVTTLLGKGCMVNIIHKQSQKDATKIYSKIGSVSGIPKGTTVPPQASKTFLLSYDDFDFTKFDTLPDFIKDKMKTSLEFASLTTLNSKQTAAVNNIPAPIRNETGNVIPSIELTDDLPF